jgi:hypothetical protein
MIIFESTLTTFVLLRPLQKFVCADLLNRGLTLNGDQILWQSSALDLNADQILRRRSAL